MITQFSCISTYYLMNTQVLKQQIIYISFQSWCFFEGQCVLLQKWWRWLWLWPITPTWWHPRINPPVCDNWGQDSSIPATALHVLSSNDEFYYGNLATSTAIATLSRPCQCTINSVSSHGNTNGEYTIQDSDDITVTAIHYF